jgi:hypothetical protein
MIAVLRKDDQLPYKADTSVDSLFAIKKGNENIEYYFQEGGGCYSFDLDETDTNWSIY